mgnify:FL=1
MFIEKKTISEEVDIDKLVINELLVRKMFEWDSKAKNLSQGERNYIADYPWGLKKLTKFHERNIKK